MFQWLKNMFGQRSYDLRRPESCEGLFGSLCHPKAEAGVHVNEWNALTITAVRCAVTIISESFMQFPCPYYKRNGNRKEKIWHPRQRLVNTVPNKEMPSGVFRQSQIARALLWGFSLDEIVRDGGGEPQELVPVMSNRVKPDRMDVLNPVTEELEKNKLVFRVKNTNGPDTILNNEDVIFIPGLSLDGVSPEHPIYQARESLALTMACELFGARFFGEGCQATQWFEPTLDHNPESRRETMESMQAFHAGRHKLGLLPWGYKPVAGTGMVPPDNGQFLQTRTFQINEVARLFNVPPHRLKNLDRATWGNIADENESFVMDTMKPWLIKHEQEYNRKLIPEAERDDFFFEFNIDAVLRGDERSRYAIYTMGVQGGWLGIDTICEWENLPVPEKEPEQPEEQPQQPEEGEEEAPDEETPGEEDQGTESPNTEDDGN